MQIACKIAYVINGRPFITPDKGVDFGVIFQELLGGPHSNFIVKFPAFSCFPCLTTISMTCYYTFISYTKLTWQTCPDSK